MSALAPIGHMYRRAVSNVIQEGFLNDLAREAILHTGDPSFDFHGRRWKTLAREEVADTPDAVIVLAPNGNTVYLRELPHRVVVQTPAQRDARALRADAARARAEAWDRRLKRKR